ncbi:hypothetical protein LTR85_005804 [Meristemomyces frigidus]|nr:hypothetical protein LTR85_005804 [Meristemomyces frigidus]
MRAPTLCLALGLAGCVLGSNDGQIGQHHRTHSPYPSSSSSHSDRPIGIAEQLAARAAMDDSSDHLERDFVHDTAADAILPSHPTSSGDNAPSTTSDQRVYPSPPGSDARRHFMKWCCKKGLDDCCRDGGDHTKRHLIDEYRYDKAMAAYCLSHPVDCLDDAFDSIDVLHKRDSNDLSDRLPDTADDTERAIEAWHKVETLFGHDDDEDDYEDDRKRAAEAEPSIGNGAIPTPSAGLNACGKTPHTPGFVSTITVAGTPAIFSVVATSPEVDVFRYGDRVHTVTKELGHQERALSAADFITTMTEMVYGFPVTEVISAATNTPAVVAVLQGDGDTATFSIGMPQGTDGPLVGVFKESGDATTVTDYPLGAKEQKRSLPPGFTLPDLQDLTVGFATTVKGMGMDGSPATVIDTVTATDPIRGKEIVASHGRKSTTTAALADILSAAGYEMGKRADTVQLGTDSSGQGQLTPTTDADGNAIFVTRTGNWALTTVTVSSSGLTLTVYANATSTAPTTVTETVSAAQPMYTEVHTTTITETMFDPLQRCIKKQNPFMASTTIANLFGHEFHVTAATQTHNNTVIVVPPSPQATLFPLSRYQDFVLALLDVAQNQDALDDNARNILDSDMSDLRTRHPSVDWVTVAELGYVLQKAHGTIDRDLAMKFATIWVLEHPEISGRADRAAKSSCSGGMAELDGTPITMTLPVQTQGNTVLVAADRQLTKRDGAMTMTDANINGDIVPITRSTQPYGSSTIFLVATTTPFNYASAARHNFERKQPKAIPPPCVKGPDHNKTACKRAKCMMKHYRPINITTVFPAAMLGDNGETAYGYFTHSTELTGAHFGKTKASATYYPTKATAVMDKSFRLVPTATVEVPYDVGMRRLRGIQDETKVWDHKTCCARCEWEAKHNKTKWLLWGGLGLAIMALLGALTCLCCYKLFKRHRAKTAADPNHSYRRRLGMFGRRKNPTAVVVDLSTGQPMAQVVQTSGGHTVDPALAAAGGAVAGSTLAGDHPGNAGTTSGTGGQTVVSDGKGTLGRKAEEGRGKVQFAEGTAPAAGAAGQSATKVVTTPSGEQVVTTAPTGASTTEHAVAAPASGTTEQVVTAPTQHLEPITARHDGANDGAPTGRQTADTGSMRGRRKARQDGAYPDLLNLRF